MMEEKGVEGVEFKNFGKAYFGGKRERERRITCLVLRYFIRLQRGWVWWLLLLRGLRVI